MNKGLVAMPQDDANLTDLAFINRQLHATIEAMRAKLEAEHQTRDDRIAQAHAVVAEEHRDLQNAIQAMRIQLELQQANHDAALQAERALAHGQIQQFIATINQLRIEIEVLEHKGMRELDEQLAEFAREQVNWKAQVQALRNELEQRA